MSSTTPYLGLVLYDSTGDQSVSFATFRAVWGGPATSSNFYKIDTAWGGLDARIDILEAYRGAIPVPSVFVSSNYYEANGLTSILSYTTGMTIILSVDTTSSGTVTLNINSLGTKSVMKVDSTGTPINLTGSDLVDGRQYLFMYDGTRWLWVSANSADQIQIVGTSGNVVTVGSTNSLDGTLTQSLLVSQTINSATAKTTPVDADLVGLIDSAASNVLKSLSWANIKATLKTYFDSLTTTLTNKTLTAPVIATIVNSGTLTLPTSTDTLIGRATTDTVTNKRIQKRAVTVTQSATPSINTDNGDIFNITGLAQAITSLTSGLSGTPVADEMILIQITDNGTARAITRGASFASTTNAIMATTTISGKKLMELYKWNATTSLWECMASTSSS